MINRKEKDETAKEEQERKLNEFQDWLMSGIIDPQRAEEIIELYFPYQSSEKISVFTLEKKPTFEGVLKGIKGQYLHFDGDYFINIRNHEGYVVDLEID